VYYDPQYKATEDGKSRGRELVGRTPRGGTLYRMWGSLIVENLDQAIGTGFSILVHQKLPFSK
jgi:hypothetical protein